MFTIYVVGASHGKKISRALRRLQGYGTVFQVCCLCVGGKKFYDLNWPNLNTLKETDLLLVLPFGNDLIDRNNISRDQFSKIHLTQFQPRPNSYFEERYRVLESKLNSTVAQVRIISNFFRHFCCDTHFHPGWVGYRNRLNRDLLLRFPTTAKVKVLDHRGLLGLPYRKARNVLQYRNLQYDSVHFRDYLPIAKKILESVL